jgi:diphthine methyl ester acylhydrolase
VQTLPYPSALLDLHFHPRPDKYEILATVSSTGTLSFFRLALEKSPSNPLVKLATHTPLEDCDESVLFLSCAWHPSLPQLLAVTTSNYQVYILRIDDAWNAYQASSVPVITHALEAWTVAFSPFLGGAQGAIANTALEGSRALVVYSGGDDSKLLSTTCFYNDRRGTGCKNGEDDVTMPYPIVTTKGHAAGITAILPLPLKLSDRSELVVTGSYDDCLRIFSIHPQVGSTMARPPKLLFEENLGGGVWRLKLIKVEESTRDGTASQGKWSALVLASCMHAGSRVLELSGDYSHLCQLQILGRFEEHKSMNYGTDFQPGTELDGQVLHCVSTSFYDRLLCLWKL